MFVSWLIRYGHVLFATMWVGGYALLAFFIVPMIERGEREALIPLAITVVRFLTYTGTLTMGFGIVLITKTNGFSHLFGTAWGGMIITAFVIAVVLLGIGDGALRPAIRRMAKTDITSGVSGRNNNTARIWAIVGFALTVLAVGVMTGATFVG